MRSMHIFVYIKWSQLRDFAFFQIPEVSGALAEVHKKLSTSNTYRVKDYSIYFKKLVTALKYLGKICGNESLTKHTPPKQGSKKENPALNVTETIIFPHPILCGFEYVIRHAHLNAKH